MNDIDIEPRSPIVATFPAPPGYEVIVFMDRNFNIWEVLPCIGFLLRDDPIDGIRFVTPRGECESWLMNMDVGLKFPDGTFRHWHTQAQFANVEEYVAERNRMREAIAVSRAERKERMERKDRSEA